MKFIVGLADEYIEINSVYDELKNFFKDYLVNDVTPDFSVSLSKEDILAEQEATSENQFSPAYLETLALLRKLAEILPSHNRILMHGASISYNEHAYLFTAPSGTGKSTHIRLWKKYLGDDVKIVNGDKPFISLEDEPVIYGSPWAGKENWHRNCKMPLKGICFVQRGTTNSIRRIEASDCLSLLFKQVYLPADTLAAGLTLELVDILIKKVPLYVLTCDMSEDAVRCSFEALTGLSYPIS
jgi:hypothetical protein